MPCLDRLGNEYKWCKDSHYTINGEDYCVFHASHLNKLDQSGKQLKAGAFNQLIFDKIHKVNEHNKTNDEKIICNLSGTIFPINIDLNLHSLPMIDFSDTTFINVADFGSTIFTDKVDFSKATFMEEANFGWAAFIDKADFRVANFTKAADFTMTTFTKDAYFRWATFKEEAAFRETTFIKESDFNNATFTKEAYFSEATFTEKARFMGASFKKEAYFREATFTDKADFRMVTFAEKADFSKTEFIKEAYFRLAIFTNKVDLSNASFAKEADFSEAKINSKIIFRGATFNNNALFKYLKFDTENAYLNFHNVNLKQAAFRHTDLTKCEFTTCNWNNHKGRYKLLDEDLYWSNIWDSDDERIERIKSTESLYRTMKHKAIDEHNTFDYSFWHYSEKEMQRMRTWLFRKQDSVSAWLHNALEWLTLNVYKHISGYGESPLIAFGWLVGLVIFVAICMAGLGIIDPTVAWEEVDGKLINKSLIDFSNMTIESAKETFVTTFEHLSFVRPTNYVPATLGGRFLMALFKILTPIQAALFAFALRNRFRR